APGNQMLLDDPLEHGRIAARVPRALRIDDGNRTAFADAQTVGLGPKDAALLGEPELLQSALEKLPRREAAILLTALRRGLVAAKKDVPAGGRTANRFCDETLRITRHHRHVRLTRRILPDPIRVRVRSAAPCSRPAPMQRRPPGWRDSPRHPGPSCSA